LFNANTVEKPLRTSLTELPITIACLSESQRLDPFSGEPAGRSPPSIG
jgi:hypothetical protein